MQTVVLLEFKSNIQSQKARSKALADLMKFLRRRLGAFSLTVDWASSLWKLVIPQQIPLASILVALRRFMLMKPSIA